MVYRVYVEKKDAYAQEARSLFSDIRSFLGISALTKLRLLNRYDVEGITEELFDKCRDSVFSEPPLDVTLDTADFDADAVFAVEYLPGQFDQRADSAAQCIQLISQTERPLVRTARVYLLYGNLCNNDISAIKKYIINPVESREAALSLPETLVMPYDIPENVPVLDGFTDNDDDALRELLSTYGLAMDFADICFCRDYFRGENRNPTLTELRVIDTYWSDHCRHTTFLTEIDDIDFKSEDVQRAFNRYMSIRRELGVTKPVTLMNMATIAVKYLKKTGALKNLDESDEINACTVKIDVDVDGKTEKWLLLFKNETHNHPTEIEPFGGAATCIGGAIRDPLSGRSYVYQAMRVTGGANPLVPIESTISGKLPQRQILTSAAAGNSSYGNQIGLATGLVDEIYHDGYLAKHMEIGAVVGATPEENVRRLVPVDGDVVVLLGGRTGRDGCGGATGSSKSHSVSSLEQCGSEVQKGNAPEERKLQRLFRNPEAAKLIKRCNDFGAGGVSVAIGELADGLTISLDAVPKKYEGLDGTELAISESQERMAVVLERTDVERFKALASTENLEATIVAVVTEAPRLVMNWRNRTIVDLSREFLNSNGAPKHVSAIVEDKSLSVTELGKNSLEEKLCAVASELNVCSKRGLAERFDSTIGGNTVLMPFGGKYQRTPTQAMAAKLPVLAHETNTCSVMSYGFNPNLMEQSPYHGAYCSVVESVAKLIATGAYTDKCYLTFQEYFERLGSDPVRWGKPLSALLGALDAQLDLELAAIGGKDSMSGSFESIDVPPTLVSFAVSVCNTKNIISPEFKKTGSRVVLLAPKLRNNGLPDISELLKIFKKVHEMIACGKVISAYTPCSGGIAAGILKMALGNKIGFAFSELLDIKELFDVRCGGFVLELSDNCEPCGIQLGKTISDYVIEGNGEVIDINKLSDIYESKLESVYPSKTADEDTAVPAFSYPVKTRVAPKIGIIRPKVLIPVFPGTNCEYDTANAMRKAGADYEIMVIKNLCAAQVSESVEAFVKQLAKAQILFIPGGFSGGDEPEGSAKLITAFLKNPHIMNAVHTLLNSRDGLICGICNGFQALIKLGLVPFGEITDASSNAPTLTFNTIGRHQSRLVRTRVASNKSPWLMHSKVGDVHLVPISHGEGRFVCDADMLSKLSDNGQIATQYVDMNGVPSMGIDVNPNGSVAAIEGITSPDGRVFGKMAHSERSGNALYKNVPQEDKNNIFRGAVDYFKI